nr:RNA polymerase sigma factor [Tissierella sp.]
MEEKLLIKRAKKGDKEALITLIMNQKSEYYKLAYVYMKNQEDALDAMQDMIVIVYEKVHTLKKDEAFYSWSKTILVNTCKKLLKMNKKTISIETIKEQEEVSYQLDNSLEDKMVLENYLAHLKPIHSEVIRLKFILDLDYDSIASLLKIPLGTVKSRINTAMKTLRETMEGENRYEKYR